MILNIICISTIYPYLPRPRAKTTGHTIHNLSWGLPGQSIYEVSFFQMFESREKEDV